MVHTEAKKSLVQSNKLIDGKQSMTLSEKKIISHMISQVSHDDKDFKNYRLYIKDFMEMDGSNRTGLYKQAKQITKQLLERVLEIPEEAGLLQTHWVAHCRYINGEAYVEYSFHPDLKPYLIELRKRFTRYQLENIMHCRSVYSIRLYEILKSFEGLGERVISLVDLRFMLNIEKTYPRFVDIKRRILEPAKREIDLFTDISFTYTKVKSGRNIVAVKFEISANKQLKIKFGTGPRPVLKKERPTLEWMREVRGKKRTANPLI